MASYKNVRQQLCVAAIIMLVVGIIPIFYVIGMTQMEQQYTKFAIAYHGALFLSASITILAGAFYENNKLIYAGTCIFFLATLIHLYFLFTEPLEASQEQLVKKLINIYAIAHRGKEANVSGYIWTLQMINTELKCCGNRRVGDLKPNPLSCCKEKVNYDQDPKAVCGKEPVIKKETCPSVVKRRVGSVTLFQKLTTILLLFEAVTLFLIVSLYFFEAVSETSYYDDFEDKEEDLNDVTDPAVIVNPRFYMSN